MKGSFYMLNQVIAYAEAAGGQVAEPTLFEAMLSPMIMVGLIVVMYFMMIRPQRKREKELQKMLAALKVGDKVVSIGGICGKIAKIKDNYVYLETGSVGNPNEKTLIKFERSAIKAVEKKMEA